MIPEQPEEPERWIVSADAPPELRALLEVARREGPSLVQKASLGSRLGLSVEQALIGLGGKGFALGTIVVAAATGAAFGLYTGRDAEPALTMPRAPDPPALVVAAPAPHPPAPPVTTPEPPEEKAATLPTPPPSNPRPSEAKLIRDARAALEANPARARSLLERHRLLYKTGQLAEEREVLLIEALGREGRAEEASVRAADFRQKNPESAHRPLVTPK